MIPINAYVRETAYKISDLAFVANVVTDPGIFVVRAESPYKTPGRRHQGGQGEAGRPQRRRRVGPRRRLVRDAPCSKGRRRSNSISSPFPETALPGRPRWPATSTPPPTTWASSTRRCGRASCGRWRSCRTSVPPSFRMCPPSRSWATTSPAARRAGFAMPKNTPKAIVDKFANAVKQVMSTEEFKANALKTAFPVRLPGAGRIRRLHEVAGHDLSAPLGQIRKIAGRRCAKDKIASQRYSCEDRFSRLCGIDPCGRSGLWDHGPEHATGPPLLPGPRPFPHDHRHISCSDGVGVPPPGNPVPEERPEAVGASLSRSRTRSVRVTVTCIKPSSSWRS